MSDKPTHHGRDHRIGIDVSGNYKSGGEDKIPGLDDALNTINATASAPAPAIAPLRFLNVGLFAYTGVGASLAAIPFTTDADWLSNDAGSGYGTAEGALLPDDGDWSGDNFIGYQHFPGGGGTNITPFFVKDTAGLYLMHVSVQMGRLASGDYKLTMQVQGPAGDGGWLDGIIADTNFYTQSFTMNDDDSQHALVSFNITQRPNLITPDPFQYVSILLAQDSGGPVTACIQVRIVRLSPT